MMDAKEIIEHIERFPSLKVLVIGDVIVDKYYKGNVDRVSPEAPVPILNVESKEERLGGAANVAINVKALGAEPILCSVIGQDSGGSSVLSLMKKEGLNTDGLLSVKDRPTSVKSRMMSGHFQLLRTDEETTEPLNKDTRDALTHKIKMLILDAMPDAIIFEDYDKGVIDAELIHDVVKLANERGVLTTVDPKSRNFWDYKHVSLFKPNLKELREGLNILDLDTSSESLEAAFAQLKEKMPVEAAFFTLSGDGVYITNGDSNHRIAAHKRNISDVSGAGDTVIAVATCAMAAQMSLEEVASISNLAGGWVCQFPGVVSIDLEALKAEIQKLN